MGIGGKYELVDSERYDDYLKSVGAGIIEREQAWKFKPYLEYAPTTDGKWTQRTILGLKNCDISFVPGEEFDELFFGTKLKSRITLEGNKLIHKQKIGPVEATVIREFNGNELICMFIVGDTVATRVFKKVA